MVRAAIEIWGLHFRDYFSSLFTFTVFHKEFEMAKTLNLHRYPEKFETSEFECLLNLNELHCLVERKTIGIKIH